MSETLQSMDNLADVGRIVMADSVGQAMKEYREKFGVRQVDLSRQMQITSGVLSDYEHGRRPSPGASFIKKYVLGIRELCKGTLV